MADSLTLLDNAKGPLPVQTDFTSESDAPALLMVSGTVWSVQADTPVGISIRIDGDEVGKATIYANPAQTHLALPAQFLPVKLTIGQHTLEVAAETSQTTADQNDTFNAVLLY